MSSVSTPMIRLVATVLVIALGVSAHAHKDGPGSHSAKKHDLVASHISMAANTTTTAAGYEELWIENVCRTPMEIIVVVKSQLVTKTFEDDDPEFGHALVHAYEYEIQKACEAFENSKN